MLAELHGERRGTFVEVFRYSPKQTMQGNEFYAGQTAQAEAWRRSDEAELTKVRAVIQELIRSRDART